jgi:hypothetical protein
MSKHTPGPWKWQTYGELLGKDASRVLYACHSDLDGSSVEFENNSDASLIAAAPELYEIAKRTAAHFEDTDAPLGIAARAALAKVDGESK